MSENSNQKNADRFKGFADVYDDARPTMPIHPINVIKRYLQKTPDTVIDLGCGTGLSTLSWKGHCKHVIGIEPSEDMFDLAKQKSCESVCFQKGFGNNTGLKDKIADAVICSQSFHWMEPQSTLAEINRILKSGGVFATVDCDWPPVIHWKIEKVYMDLYQKVKKLEASFEDVKETFAFYSKDKHLQNISRSGYFRYCREIVFSNPETFTADRLINLLLSQGSVQVILKMHPEQIADDLKQFEASVTEFFGKKTYPGEFCYRMRIGIK